jgi:AraC-like DNA-binding protein
MTGFQRVIGPLAEIPELLAALGADIDQVFAGLDIRPDDLTLGNLIPYSELLRLLARSAELSDCPHFGLLLGAKHDHLALGPLGQLMANMPTLGLALSEYVKWQVGYSQAGAAYLYKASENYFFGYGIYEREAPGSWQVYDLTIMVASNIVAGLTGGRVLPEEVLICHRAPAIKGPYHKLLRGKISFDQSQNCLVLTQEMMQTPVLGADPAAREIYLKRVSEMIGAEMISCTARAKHLLRGAICMGDLTMSSLAGQLGMHQRTLERRLSAEGTTFDHLRDEVRYVVARDLLDLTDLPISEIALALTYATPSTFNHAFRRWSGKTPTEWRTTSRNMA